MGRKYCDVLFYFMRKSRVFFFIFENQGFISFVKWVFFEISEIKINVVQINFFVLLVFCGVMQYDCKIFGVFDILDFLKIVCLVVLFFFILIKRRLMQNNYLSNLVY